MILNRTEMSINLTGKVLGFLFLCALLSCQTEQIPFGERGNQPVVVGFYAGGAGTRTEMQDNGLSAMWMPGDEISLWAKNSTGSYTLSNQIFTTYGIDGKIGYFTSTLDNPMPEGTYTYYCCYPRPASLNGMKATFAIPTVQDGKASGGSDIMVADPIEASELNAITDEEPHNKVSLKMNRLTHQFRFWIPVGENKLGEDIRKIEMTMPDNVVGNLITDLESPQTYIDLANGSKTITIELEEPLKESEFATAEFAHAVIYPHDAAYTDDDFMKITVYGNSGKSTLDPIALSGRSFLAGHSTPVRLLPKEPEIHCALTIKTGVNYVGEPLWSVRINSGGQTLFQYDNTDGSYHNIVYTRNYSGTSGKANFDAVVNAVANGTAVLNFETNHTTFDIPMTADMMTLSGNSAELYLGDVPYLLYEDFSSATGAEHNDAYAGSSDNDRNLGGHLVTLPSGTWNAARYKVLEADCVRINCRYQSGGWIVERMCGRLDTPALKNIKQGSTANIVLEYEEAFYIPVGYALGGTFDDSMNKVAKYHIGIHRTAETSTIDGLNSGDISGMLFTSDTFASENVGNMHHNQMVINSVDKDTRIVFMVDTNQSTSHIGRNSCYYLYLDNIKVYIKN